MPELKKFYQQQQSQVALLTISGDLPGDMLPFIRKNQLAFPVLYDSTGEVFARYGVRGIPMTFIIDPAGQVVQQIPGPVNSKQLEKLIKEIK